MATVTSQQSTAAHNLSRSARAETAGYIAQQTPKYTIHRGDVDVKLNFFKAPEDGSPAFNYVEKPPAGEPEKNYGIAEHEVRIRDIRGRESDFSLDKDAFAAVQDVPDSAELAFADDESIRRNYYPELERLLLEQIPGSTRVFFFDHTIRRSTPGAARGPLTRVHIDQTPRSAAQRVRTHLPHEAERLLQGRYRIVNVWRPLNGPVATSPLALASSRSFDDADLAPIEHRYPDRTGEIAGIKHNPGQEWHYWSGVTNNERLLLECFDSEALKEGTSVLGGRVPHTAFTDPRSDSNAPGRDSIEVRTLVFGP